VINQAELLLQTHLTEAHIHHKKEVRLVEDRKLRWDFVVRDIAIEIQGGVWMKKGGHNTGKGIIKDIEKARIAVIAGFYPVAFTTKEVLDGTAIKWIKSYIQSFGS